MTPTNDKFRQAALAEYGMPISAGGAPVAGDPDALEATQDEFHRRFREAALAEYGMPISAGWVPLAEPNRGRVTPLQLFTQAIEPIVPALVDKSDDELVAVVWRGVGGILGGTELVGASQTERLTEWVRTEVVRACRSAGDVGRTVLTYLDDEQSASDLERVAFVTQFLASHFGRFQNLDIRDVATLAVLILRWSHEKVAP